MSFFDPSKTQAGMNSQNPTQGTQGFNTGATGVAGDAGKTLSTGFNLTSTPSLPKPGSFFGSTPGGAAATSFGAMPSTGIQGGGLNLGTSSGTSALTFGATATPATGLNFGTSGGTATVSGFGGTGFSGGGLTSAAPTVASSAGLSFGAQKATTMPASSTFSLSGTSAAPASIAPKLTFGIGGAMPTNTAFSIGGTSITPVVSAVSTAPITAFGTTTPAATVGQTPGIGTLGAPISTSGFSLTPNTTAQTLTSGFGIGQTSTAPAVSTGFSAGGATATPASGFNLGGGATATPASGFNLGGGATATPASSFNLGGGATPALSTGFSVNKIATTLPAATTSATNVAPQTSLGTVTTVSSAGSAQSGTMNFCQLEESINKWTLELEEQEKVFVNQATQVNFWDKLLIANGEKIATLNQEVERVKLEQQHLEHELDYVVGQQKELQDCLVPLEKELASLSIADPERDYTYRLAENLDKQLKQMSQDLKEIIEHLNEANRSQDSSDPIVQIGKILNAHMNSLQWLDQRTSLIGQKIQQIDQMHQNFRQENERSFNLAYN